MSRIKRATALAAVACAVLAVRRRGIVASSVGAAVRRRRDQVPKGILEYPAPLVDHRHLPEGAEAAQPGHGTTGMDVAGEFYADRPPA